MKTEKEIAKEYWNHLQDKIMLNHKQEVTKEIMKAHAQCLERMFYKMPLGPSMNEWQELDEAIHFYKEKGVIK